MTTIRRAFQERPLLAVLILAAVLRLIAVFRSRGFLTVDDHLVLIDTADRVASGIGFPRDFKRSILYPGSVALVMEAMRALGNTSPDVEMLVLRVLHAAGAMLGVYCAFRIAERAAGQPTALMAGLLMAVFFLLPVASVHQFEEAVCQVPLLAGWWWLLKADDAPKGAAVWSFLSGAATMTTLVVRFPALPFVIAFAALALWRPAQRFSKPLFALGLLVVFGLQVASNALVNGDPWYYFFETAGHRAGVGLGYPEGPPWKYIGTLVYVFLPPFSLLFLAAAIRGGRIFPLLGVPTLAFLIATSLVPNKQERFLLPVLPALLILGAVGMPSVRDWFVRAGWGRVYRWAWGYFVGVNTLLLAVGIFSYGKKDRVEPLVQLQRRHDVRGIIEAQFSYVFPVPTYYLGTPRPPVFVFESPERLAAEIAAVRPALAPVNYVILYSDSVDVDRRRLEGALGKTLVLDLVVPPSLGDRVAHAVNPKRNHATPATVFAVR